MGRRRRSSFVHEGAEGSYLARYDAMLERWPEHSHTELSTRYRIHAVDTMGEPGRSRNDGMPLRRRADYAIWLAGTLDALELPTVHLCGHSFGGWLAATFTTEYPGRIRTLTLLDPAQVFAPFSPGWLAACLPPFLHPTEHTVGRLFRRLERGGAHHEDLVDLATAGMLSFNLKAPEATRVSRGALRRLPVPTQQLIAEHTIVHSPDRAIRTAARRNPAVISRLVPGSSHFVPHDRPDVVIDALHDVIGRTPREGTR